jgi:urease accessory protein
LTAILRDRDLQRVDGAARIAVRGADGRTSITDLFQRSPCKVLMPDIDGHSCREAVFLNTAGGIAGGDRLSFGLSASGEASFTGTTQASERVYRAIDAPGEVRMRIEAAGTATLQWLPQETILFDGGRLDRSTHIHVSGAARLIAMDWLVLGRAASGETVRHGAFRDDWRVFRDGRLVWADAFRLSGDIETLVHRPSLLAGHTAIATILYAAANAPAALDRARAILAGLSCKAGATIVNGLMICRFAAKAAAELRRAVTDFLRAFRNELEGFTSALPKVWAC